MMSQFALFEDPVIILSGFLQRGPLKTCKSELNRASLFRSVGATSVLDICHVR